MAQTVGIRSRRVIGVISRYSSVRLKRAKFDVQMCPDERAEFSTLSFTNSLEVNYFCQITDVVVPPDATPDTIFLLLYSRDGLMSVIVFSPATSPVPEI